MSRAQPALPSIKGGNLFIDAVDLPPQLQPGESFDVTVTVVNGAAAIAGTDRDACRNDANPCPPPGFLESAGYCYEVEIAPEWTAATTGSNCIHLAVAGVNTQTVTGSFSAPASDSQLTVRLRGRGSGEVASETIPVVVADGDGNGGNGGDGGNGNGGNGDNGNGGDGDGELIFGLPRNQVLIAGGGLAIGAGLLLLGRDSDARDSARQG